MLMHLPISPEWRLCRKQDLPPLAELMAAAYINYPEMRYYFPRSTTRQRDAKWLCYTLLKVAWQKGEVYADPRLRSCMALLPPGVSPASNWNYALAGYWQFPFRYGMAATRKISHYNASMDAKHRHLMAGREHYHLWMLAVHPRHQTGGLGSRLVTALCTTADAESKAIYLETHTQANSLYYQRFGFEDLGQVDCPQKIPFWPMKREPQINAARVL